MVRPSSAAGRRERGISTRVSFGVRGSYRKPSPMMPSPTSAAVAALTWIVFRLVITGRPVTSSSIQSQFFPQDRDVFITAPGDVDQHDVRLLHLCRAFDSL